MVKRARTSVSLLTSLSHPKASIGAMMLIQFGLGVFCQTLPVGSLFGMSYCLLQEKIVAITVKLTQAGMSRLGKINRGSPKYFSMNGRPGDPLYFLSERMSRLGEEGLASENACKVPILEVELSPRQRELA
ncbi:hypothetical protein DEO72_LG5g870 [Vigna unguiculata]|uniref:Uncharacterized protein n=1 Tax=Vigna unguiculata TaxID=3917 RepID=A0A4D6LWK6_VIGUN|nr:hypothetical protein DEO72_LG5g870 [Vigna unguiculata]